MHRKGVFGDGMKFAHDIHFLFLGFYIEADGGRSGGWMGGWRVGGIGEWMDWGSVCT
jgi:hypothetical protein